MTPPSELSGYRRCIVKIAFPVLYQVPFREIQGKKIILKDLMGPARFERDGSELLNRGLYLDTPAYGYHVFDAEIV